MTNAGGLRDRRRTVLAWSLLTLAAVAMVAGMLRPHGLLLAAGLTLAGVGVRLLDTRRHLRR